jgi:RNA polymerase sigma-70 factor, ECF subfamily
MTMSFSALAPKTSVSGAAANTNGQPDDLNVLTDDDLVRCAQRGDGLALEELLGRYKVKLLALAKRFVPNEYDAEEVVQDVFLTTWRKLPGFEGRAQIGTWLHRVTVNAALMFLRARSRRSRSTTIEVGVGDPLAQATAYSDGVVQGSRGPDDQLQSAELHREIQKAVDELPSSLRQVVIERLVEGRSTRQTAQVLGLSTLVGRRRLHRARVRLRANITDYRAA